MGQITPEDIQWRLAGSRQMGKKHHTAVRDDELGVQRESISQNDCYYTETSRKPNVSWFIDNDPREFKTVEEMCDAYNELYKLQDENPEHEVKYVRVIKRRDNGETVKVETV